MAKTERAELCHSVPGRARLRFLSQDLDAAAFTSLGETLLGIAGVHEVRVNPRTRSVLVFHEGELDSIVARAAEQGLLEIVRHVPRAPMRRIELAITEVDDRLYRESDGAVSLGTLTFLGLLAAGIFQAREGKLLPAGMTLFNQALDVMQREARREERLRTRSAIVAETPQKVGTIAP